MKEGILVIDRDRRVLLGNQAARVILGFPTHEELADRPLILVARDRTVIEGFDAALLRGESSTHIVQAGSGSDRSYEINVSPLTDPAGAQVGAIGVLFDTTRLSALENVRREFVADVSHELRTPLTSIKAFVETLLSGGLEDPSNNRRFLEIVQKHSDRMEALIDDLTDLSLIETGAVALEIEPFDLSAQVRDLLEAFRPSAESRGVRLEASVPSGTMLSADRRRVEQVFVNLIDNAVKFNRRGGTVTIRVEPGSNHGSGLRAEVADTGVGIPEDALQRIFHRFYRVDRARSRALGGTGLGLSIVKHIMQLHGGSVRAESWPGRGSRFVLEFPAVPHSTAATH
jgi:two-component system phosphate regulon sensor histidine kinase PhoR